MQAGRCLQTLTSCVQGCETGGKGLGLPGLETQHLPLAGSGDAQLGTTRGSPWTQQRASLLEGTERAHVGDQLGGPCPHWARLPPQLT